METLLCYSKSVGAIQWLEPRVLIACHWPIIQCTVSPHGAIQWFFFFWQVTAKLYYQQHEAARRVTPAKPTQCRACWTLHQETWSSKAQENWNCLACLARASAWGEVDKALSEVFVSPVRWVGKVTVVEEVDQLLRVRQKVDTCEV